MLESKSLRWTTFWCALSYANRWLRQSNQRFECYSQLHLKYESMIRELCPSSNTTDKNHTLTNPVNVGATNFLCERIMNSSHWIARRVACGAILLENAKSFLVFVVKSAGLKWNTLYTIYRTLQQMFEMASNYQIVLICLMKRLLNCVWINLYQISFVNRSPPWESFIQLYCIRMDELNQIYCSSDRASLTWNDLLRPVWCNNCDLLINH